MSPFIEVSAMLRSSRSRVISQPTTSPGVTDLILCKLILAALLVPGFGKQCRFYLEFVTENIDANTTVRFYIKIIKLFGLKRTLAYRFSVHFSSSKQMPFNAPLRHSTGKSRCVFSLANSGLAKTPEDIVPAMSFSKGLPFALKKGLWWHTRKNLEDYIRYLSLQ